METSWINMLYEQIYYHSTGTEKSGAKRPALKNLPQNRSTAESHGYVAWGGGKSSSVTIWRLIPPPSCAESSIRFQMK
jgi:hypothetical protein